MSDHRAVAGEVANHRLEERHADETAGETPQRRGVLATAWSAVTAVVGGIMGLLPHLLHHVGLLGGAVLVTGATGNVVFAVLGLVLSLPCSGASTDDSARGRRPPSPSRSSR
jgi:hypothetical protein